MLKEMIPKLMKHIIIKVTEIFGVFRFIPLLFIIFSCEKTPLSSENEFGSIQFLIMINNNDNTSMSPSQPSVWSKLRTVSTVQISLSGPQSTEVTLQLSGKSVSHTIDDLKEGSYSVKVSLKDSKSTLLYQEAKTVTVSAGATANPTFNNFVASNLSLFVSSPSGQLSYADGQKISIAWSGSHTAEPVKIQLMRSNSVVSTISASTKSSPLSWTIPSNLTTSDKYSIKVSYVSDANVSSSSNNIAIKFPVYSCDFSYLCNPPPPADYCWGGSDAGVNATSIVSGRLKMTGDHDPSGNLQHKIRESGNWNKYDISTGQYINALSSEFEYSIDIDFTSTANSNDWGFHGIGVMDYRYDGGSGYPQKEYMLIIGDNGNFYGVIYFDWVSQTWGEWFDYASSSALADRKGRLKIKYQNNKLSFYFNNNKLSELSLSSKLNFATATIYHQDFGIVYYDNAKVYDKTW
jgi:hypothetical protein